MHPQRQHGGQPVTELVLLEQPGPLCRGHPPTKSQAPEGRTWPCAHEAHALPVSPPHHGQPRLHTGQLPGKCAHQTPTMDELPRFLIPRPLFWGSPLERAYRRLVWKSWLPHVLVHTSRSCFVLPMSSECSLYTVFTADLQTRQPDLPLFYR